jgi:dolichyl-phosphate beta-glucosyltransferase
MSSPGVVVVIPCFDEADRLDTAALLDLALKVDRLLLVDDGSTDATGTLLDTLAAQAGGAVEVVHLSPNGGKAEAVRAGIRKALASGARIVGYYDADLATPPSELLRLIDEIRDDPHRQAVLGSRVALLGHSIERHWRRHYLGRVYGTLASIALGITVYDTQCGVKLFRRSAALEAAVATPFGDRWAFDVELLARLLRPVPGVEPVTVDQIVEVPLRQWSDVGGSKLRATSAVRAVMALVGVRRRMRRHPAAR